MGTTRWPCFWLKLVLMWMPVVWTMIHPCTMRPWMVIWSWWKCWLNAERIHVSETAMEEHQWMYLHQPFIATSSVSIHWHCLLSSVSLSLINIRKEIVRIWTVGAQDHDSIDKESFCSILWRKYKSNQFNHELKIIENALRKEIENFNCHVFGTQAHVVEYMRASSQ